MNNPTTNDFIHQINEAGSAAKLQRAVEIIKQLQCNEQRLVNQLGTSTGANAKLRGEIERLEIELESADRALANSQTALDRANDGIDRREQRYSRIKNTTAELGKSLALERARTAKLLTAIGEVVDKRQTKFEMIRILRLARKKDISK